MRQDDRAGQSVKLKGYSKEWPAAHDCSARYGTSQSPSGAPPNDVGQSRPGIHRVWTGQCSGSSGTASPATHDWHLAPGQLARWSSGRRSNAGWLYSQRPALGIAGVIPQSWIQEGRMAGHSRGAFPKAISVITNRTCPSPGTFSHPGCPAVSQHLTFRQTCLSSSTG